MSVIFSNITQTHRDGSTGTPIDKETEIKLARQFTAAATTQSAPSLSCLPIRTVSKNKKERILIFIKKRKNEESTTIMNYSIQLNKKNSGRVGTLCVNCARLSEESYFVTFALRFSLHISVSFSLSISYHLISSHNLNIALTPNRSASHVLLSEAECWPITSDRSHDDGPDDCCHNHDRVIVIVVPMSAMTNDSCDCGCANPIVTPADATTTTTTFCHHQRHHRRRRHDDATRTMTLFCHHCHHHHHDGVTTTTMTTSSSQRRPMTTNCLHPLQRRRRHVHGCANDGHENGGPVRDRRHSNGCGIYLNRRTHVRYGIRSS